MGKRAAQFVRNQRRVVIAGQPLDARRAGRIGASGWLIPEDFLDEGAVPARARDQRRLPGSWTPKAPSARTVKADIALEELRFRSYPSFTRVVVETGAALAYASCPGRTRSACGCRDSRSTEPRDARRSPTGS